MSTDGTQLCVVGLGLIGGSVLRAAVRAGWTGWGATESGADAEAAAGAGFDASTDVAAALRRAAAADALVLLAVPLPAVGDVLAAVDKYAPGCRLTDVTGVKQPVVDAVAQAAPSARFVGGHPMAGRSAWGWAAGSADLFDAAPWVLLSEDTTDVEVWTQVAGLALACGAHVVPASAREHDAAVGRVSHLPHVLATVLASVGAAGGPLPLALGAGSFTDGTRVAGSNPEHVRAMCEGNRAALLDAIDDALGRLGAARASLSSTGSLAATVRAGHLARNAFDTARGLEGGTEFTVDLRSAGAFERLREIGKAGGRVAALHGTRCRVLI